jgi:serine/threonine protein kinase
MSGTKVIPESGQPHCPQCGTLLPSGALAGLCPACLLQIGAAADTVTDGKQPAFVPPTIAELAPLFPQLEILELIGKGGMGAVYKARQKELDRIVALKILPPGIGTDAAFAARFAREAKALAKLNHSGIVTLFEFGSCAGLDLEKEKGRKGAGEQQPPGNEVTSAPLPPFSPAPSGSRSSTCDARPPLYYFLMEFVDGLNLRQLLHAGRIAPREALAIVPQICEALQFAHDLGIVHRDIKPENILLDRRGRVKVADFGLAKIVGGNELLSRPSDTLSQSDGERAGERGDLVLTEAGKVMGTPQYMSPEQFDAPGEVDHRADIYALGVVFYQMLTGELPGKKIEAPSKKVQIDVRLDEVVLRALEKKPELRYQHASVLKTELETLAAEARQSDVSVPKTVVRPDRLLAPVNAGFAAAVTFFYAGVVLSILLIGVLPFRFSRDYAYLLGVGLVLVVTPFVGVAVTNALRQMQASGDNIRWQALVARLKAASVVAWLLALPVIGFAIFFLIALFSERGGWNPAISEAVLVPLTWLGAVLLPLSGKRLWEAAAPGSRGRESVPPESERAQAHQGPLTSAATVQEPRLSYPAVAGAGWALLLGICLLAENLGLNTSVLGPLSLLAPVTTTLLGWISVSQIRRSGRKTYGLKLAVFDGLLFPLLALNAVLLYAPAKPAADLLAGVLAAEQKLALVIWVACAAPFWWAFDWWVIRRVWRAVKSSSDGRDRKTPRAPDRASRVVWAGALVVATAILGIVLATFFFARNGSTNDIASLVNQPHKLRSLPNAMVIQVGLAEPKSAWAWQELEKRAQKGTAGPPRSPPDLGRFHSVDAARTSRGL